MATSYTTKHQTRFLVIKGLYWHAMNQSMLPMNEMIQTLVAEEQDIDTIDEPFFTSLLNHVEAEKDHYNTLVTQHLNNEWKLERLDKVLLAILHAAIAEITHESKTPSNVLIDEYTGLTAYFNDDKDVAFVNAMLQKLTQTLRPHESQRTPTH